MFRTTFAAVLYFSAASPGSAAGLLSDAPAVNGQAGPQWNSSLITRDHIQTQLDWRSYYLNRMAIRRRDLLQDPHLHDRPADDRTY